MRITDGGLILFSHFVKAKERGRYKTQIITSILETLVKHFLEGKVKELIESMEY
jgi:hypothetical protein